MNQSLKSVLALVILLLLAASVLGWATRGIEGVPNSRFWMRMSGILLPPTIALLAWADFRKDRVPDLLRKHVGKYFERDGFCVAVACSISNTHFAWHIFFQNRYERPCKATVAFRPAARNFGIGRPNLGEVRIEIDCEGGAFGCATIPYGIPPKFQGKKMRFEITAVTQFPAGKGRMLRFRDGMPLAETYKSKVDVAITALSTIALHPHITRPATFKANLPKNASNESVGEINRKVLWRPGDPVQ